MCKKAFSMIAGSIVALVTPWDAQGKLDRPSLDKLIDLHNNSGTQALVVAGSTGEGLLLTPSERKEIIQSVVQQSLVPVIVGCGAPSTHETIRLGEEALSLGAHALLVVAPYYVKPSASGLVKHFSTICELWQKPVIAYNNPGRCVVDMSVKVICEIANNPHIIGLKDSSTDLTRVGRIRSGLKRTITLLAGEDSCATDYIQKGGDGWVSVVGNVAPKMCRRVCNGEGMPPELSELISALDIAGNPVAIKEALSYAGHIRHDVRLPLVPIDQPNERLKQAVRACV